LNRERMNLVLSIRDLASNLQQLMRL
jgi:hypothetical protein